jgi:peptidoglycan/LPS O-acetylase OafA/YrhL
VAELDGIRGTAILLVLVWHYAVVPGLSGDAGVARLGLQAWSGVDLFFVLSGFLIGGILIDAREADNYFRVFYLRRALRILPIYIACCSAYPLVHLVTATKAMPWPVYASFTQNFWLARHGWDVYLDVTWSLAVEEQFYLTLPLVIWAVPPRHLRRVATGVIVAAFLLRSGLYLYLYPNFRAGAYTLMFCRVDSLMMGVLAATLVREGWRNTRLLRVVAVCGFTAIAAATPRGWGMMSTAMSTAGYSVLGAAYCSLLLLAITNPGGATARVFRMRWLRWLGTIAYGTYLFHRIVLEIALEFLPSLAASAAALVACLLLAQLSWKYFEAPLVRFGHGFRYQRSLLPACESRPLPGVSRGADVDVTAVVGPGASAAV